MKFCVTALGIALLLAPPIGASEGSPDSAAIEKTVLDYIEGWYAADHERMERALHPDLAKRAINVNPKTGRSILSHLTASTMVEYTRGGGGSETPREKQKNVVTILDVHEGIASAKAVSVDYVDYVHLAKWNDRWVIVNVLWDRAEKPREGTRE
jgi:hypothetical protein